MKYKFAIHIVIFFTLMNISFSAISQITIGVFADCQYCNCETAGTRYYSKSLTKLEECITTFNQNRELEFIVSLGDIIDRDFASFDSVNSILSKSKKPVWHVIGNHDLEVGKSELEKVPAKLNLAGTWYSFSKKGWRFIILDGNDITFLTNNQQIASQAEEMTNRLKQEGKPNFHKWNGGIGPKQMEWLNSELQKAGKNKQKAAVFCHYPLLPLESHVLWNSEEVLDVFSRYNCVKLYMNGHNHAGNYAFQNGTHFVNLKGMVETETGNAFSVISFSNNKIEIEGLGREESRSLVFE